LGIEPGQGKGGVTTRVVPLIVRTATAPLTFAWGAAAAFLLLAGYQQVRVHRRDVQMRSLMTGLDSTMRRLRNREDRLTTILDEHTSAYTLKAGASGAQVFWRRDREMLYLHAYNMPRLQAGQVYELWYETPTATIAATTFAVDGSGRGDRVLLVPPEARAAIRASVTVEPGGGSPRPTGPIVVAGSIAATPSR
jgi:hypothetical protein